MIQNKELSIAEKKKEVLDKINAVIETFQKIREDLLAIIATNEKLSTSSKTNEIQGVLDHLPLEEANLLKNLEALKERNSHRTDHEIHTLHTRISNTIQESIEGIIYETKLRTIITISVKLPTLITNLSRNIKTGIGVEILALSDKKYTPIDPPINLDLISEKIFEQLENINHRIKDVSNIYKVIEYLDLTENSPILDELIDYILGGKNYNEVEVSLAKHGIIIEEVSIKPIRGSEDDLDFTTPKTEDFHNRTQKKEEPAGVTQVAHNGIIENLGFGWKIFKEWISTDRSVDFACAKERVIEKEKGLF